MEKEKLHSQSHLDFRKLLIIYGGIVTLFIVLFLLQYTSIFK